MAKLDPSLNLKCLFESIFHLIRAEEKLLYIFYISINIYYCGVPLGGQISGAQKLGAERRIIHSVKRVNSYNFL